MYSSLNYFCTGYATQVFKTTSSKTMLLDLKLIYQWNVEVGLQEFTNELEIILLVKTTQSIQRFLQLQCMLLDVDEQSKKRRGQGGVIV